MILTQWGDFFGTPDIAMSDKGPRFTGAKVRQFLRDHNSAFQTVIPGSHQGGG